MIISIDNHVGLPFLEGLCDDLQAQIRQRREAQLIQVKPKFNIFQKSRSFISAKLATLICALSGGLVALLALIELH